MFLRSNGKLAMNNKESKVAKAEDKRATIC
jgi:hypothetical protein